MHLGKNVLCIPSFATGRAFELAHQNFFQPAPEDGMVIGNKNPDHLPYFGKGGMGLRNPYFHRCTRSQSAGNCEFASEQPSSLSHTKDPKRAAGRWLFFTNPSAVIVNLQVRWPSSASSRTFT